MTYKAHMYIYMYIIYIIYVLYIQHIYYKLRVIDDECSSHRPSVKLHPTAKYL